MDDGSVNMHTSTRLIKTELLQRYLYATWTKCPSVLNTTVWRTYPEFHV